MQQAEIVRWRPHFCPQRRPHRPDQTAGDHLGSLFWWAETQPALYDGQPIALRRLCQHAGRTYCLNVFVSCFLREYVMSDK